MCQCWSSKNAYKNVKIRGFLSRRKSSENDRLHGAELACPVTEWLGHRPCVLVIRGFDFPSGDFFIDFLHFSIKY